MRLGLGLSLCGGGGAAAILQYLFNGLDTSGMTFARASAQTVADKDGTLRTVDAGVPAIEGAEFISSSEGFQIPSTFSTEQVRTKNGTVTRILEDPDWGGYLGEEARTNLFLNSESPANQTVDLTGAGTGDYTLSVHGSGSVEVAANTATGTGFGTASDGTDVTFDITGAGTVDLTVTGTPDVVQVEKGSFATSPITTAGTSVTRSATCLEQTTANVIRTQNCAVRGVVRPMGTGSDTSYLFWSGTPNVDEIIVRSINGGVVGLLKVVDSSFLSANTGYSPSAGTPFEYQSIYTDQGMAIRVREYSGGTWQAWGEWGTNANTDPVTIADTLEIGGRNGISHFNANYPEMQSLFLPSLGSLAAYQTYAENESNWGL